jgi:hypothetical protein
LLQVHAIGDKVNAKWMVGKKDQIAIGKGRGQVYTHHFSCVCIYYYYYYYYPPTPPPPPPPPQAPRVDDAWL